MLAYILIGILAVSSVKGELELFQDNNCQVELASISSDNPDFDDDGFGNAAHCVKVVGRECWSLCTDLNYAGGCMDLLAEDTYVLTGVYEDSASSAQLIECPNLVVLYEHYNYDTPMVTLTSDTASLDVHNDKTSSIWVSGPDCVAIYSNNNFNGRSQYFYPPSEFEVPFESYNFVIGNDVLSSVKFETCRSDFIFLAKAEGGFEPGAEIDIVVYTEDQPNIYNWNDKTTHISNGESCWKIFEHFNYGGDSQILSPDSDYSPEDLTFGINTLSSLKKVECPCLNITCNDNGDCENGLTGYTCNCNAGYTGQDCETDIDDCVGVTCSDYGVCEDEVDAYTCDCEVGFTGQDCETNIDDCIGVTCGVNQVCVDEVDDHDCVCITGFTGEECETNINDCVGDPCSGNGECGDLVDGYTCDCIAGFTGQDCETDIDDCVGDPCSGNGECEDLVDAYTCDCIAGFTGQDCGTNIDDCVGDPCGGYGVCEDLVDAYTCDCNAGFTGQDCETNIDDCVGDPCSGNGECGDLVDGYTCDCIAGFTGPDCETNIDDCIGDPCSGNAACEDQVEGYTCECNAGFTGQECETNIDECDGDPCSGNGACTDGVDAYTCDCNAGFTGQDCETNIDDCIGDPCSGNGECEDLVDGYTCDCIAGFTGQECETDIDDCGGVTCNNNGECVDQVEGYTCDCYAGFTGQECETGNGILLFEHGRLELPVMAVLTAATSSFIPLGFNDEVSSLEVTDSRCWALYSNIDYNESPGNSMIVEPGKTYNIYAVRDSVGNDAASSAEPVTCGLQLFEHKNFGQPTMAYLTEDTPNFGVLDINDKTSSVIAYGTNCWKLFSNYDYTGKSMIIEPGTEYDINAIDAEVENDAASSAKVVPCPS